MQKFQNLTNVSVKSTSKHCAKFDFINFSVKSSSNTSNYFAWLDLDFFREIDFWKSCIRWFHDFCVKSTHSVEKYAKTLSLWKIFRETTQGKSVKSNLTDVWFSTLRRHIWDIRYKWILFITIYTWFHSISFVWINEHYLRYFIPKIG